MEPSRRVVVLQLVSLAALGACGETPKPSGDSDDTGVPDSDTAKDTADTAKDTADTAKDTAAVDVCAESTPLPEACSVTSGDGEGPYFRIDAPERATLNVRGVEGTRLVLQGRLLDASCQPVVGARVYLWHAGTDGRYDYENPDPNLYGYVTTGDDGAFCFDTIRPPPYTDGMGGFNAAHLHINVILADTKVLTTQLYFAGDPNLEEWQDPARQLVPEALEGGGERLLFDFVLPPSG